jgi:hypothetical protein
MFDPNLLAAGIMDVLVVMYVLRLSLRLVYFVHIYMFLYAVCTPQKAPCNGKKALDKAAILQRTHLASTKLVPSQLKRTGSI